MARRERVAMFNWELVQGRMTTKYPSDSWERPYARQQPQIWFYDMFHIDGRIAPARWRLSAR